MNVLIIVYGKILTDVESLKTAVKCSTNKSAICNKKKKKKTNEKKKLMVIYRVIKKLYSARKK